MDSQPLISVLVPMYNVAEYLEKCVNSIIKQTYSNLEIILLDDGSTDNTLALANQFANQDQRIRVVHQANAGLAAGRNRLVQEATGEYLTFIDSDDYVTTDYVEFLYQLLARNNFQSPMAICSLMVDYFGKDKSDDMGDGSFHTWTAEQCLQSMCYGGLVDTCAYAKLYHCDLFAGIEYPNGKMFEDIGTTYKLFDKAKTIECGFLAKYHYVLRKNSIVTGKYSVAKLDLLPMTDQMATFVNEKYPNLKKATLRRQVYARFSTLNQTLNAPQQEVKGPQDQMISFIRKNQQLILLDDQAPRRDKLGIKLLKLGYLPYKYGWKLYLRMKKG